MKTLSAILALLVAFPAWGNCLFRAHKGSTSQGSLGAYLYNHVTWPQKKHDTHGYFNTATGKWTPPAGQVQLSASVWVVWIGDDNGGYPNYVLKLLKNGESAYENTATGICARGVFPNTAVCQIPAWNDVASGTDSYELILYTTSAGSFIDGNAAHTWFSGACSH
jgi:hypothetical protein